MEEKAPGKVTILATADGGYMISGGEFEVIWPSGNVVPTHAIAYLCRCGQSQNKPFCDDSHKRVQFKSREGDETAHK
jgi:CDGSH iron-sulfur domain-containing protein 3